MSALPGNTANLMLLDNLVKENRVVGIDQAVAPIVNAGHLRNKVFVTVLCALHYKNGPLL